MTYPFRRALVGAATMSALLLAVTACSNDDSSQQNRSSTAASSASASASEQQETLASADPSGSDRSASMDIRVTLDGRPVDATLNDSPAARDLASLLPLTVDLEDFHGTERIGDPPRKLTTDGAPEPAVPRVGDIAYYAPWGNLALFYQDGDSASADLLILGHIDADADQLSRAEHITIEAAS
ncbi:cyclophilin-like fold protein [Streptomyces scopuliridis]|uniref:cyclophilin-like fold protein n=1 Tax=Streptomyces scopuliridis TaxID=452529 RepID=UPI002DD957D1|nr:cyclophilin-like fold protein [Streptomyces scopuliridis]WSB33657.1 cyclophilin-like fold protein [Streptomyces scopuliridis]